MDAPDRIALRWETGAAVTNGPLMTHPDYTRFVRADLCADPSLLAEAVGVLRTLRDYVDDASRGILRYRGKSDISEMAGDDLVLLDNVIAKWEARYDR